MFIKTCTWCDYLYISEMCDIAESFVCIIVIEVYEAIVDILTSGGAEVILLIEKVLFRCFIGFCRCEVSILLGKCWSTGKDK